MKLKELLLPFCSELSFCLLSKNLKIKIYRTVFIILPVTYGCENLNSPLSEERRLRMFENRVLMRIFGSKRRKWREAQEDCIMRSFITCII
jgi:hypothetical protein